MTTTGTDRTSDRADPVLERMARVRVVPVLVVDDPRAAQPLDRALVATGTTLVEVTFRTAAAPAVLASLAADPERCVGAGTVLSADAVDRAVHAGGRFVVSPGLSEVVIRRSRDRGVPVIPGVATATDVMRALDLGVAVVKLFPAAALGGLAMLSALAAPFSEVRFVPTGGIRPRQAAAYLAHPAVLAVGGSWMAPRELLRAGDWTQITQLLSQTRTLSPTPTQTDPAPA